jgi:hypothetical protein
LQSAYFGDAFRKADVANMPTAKGITQALTHFLNGTLKANERFGRRDDKAVAGSSEKGNLGNASDSHNGSPSSCLSGRGSARAVKQNLQPSFC